MTEAELKDIAAFYKSPAGMKYVADPAWRARRYRARSGHLDQQTVSEYVMTRARAEMSKRGHQLTE